MDNSQVALQILSILDMKINRTINEDREFIANFIKTVRENMCSSTGTGCSVSFSHGGSAYEGLAVSEDADSDITVFLGQPFDEYNFEVERDESGFFTIQWKDHVARKIFCDCEGYIDATLIQTSMFRGLGRAIEKINISGAKIKSRDGLAALTVEIEREAGRKISLDFVPQIAFRLWRQNPYLIQLGQLPHALTQYIDILNKNKSPVFSFSLAVLGKNNYSNGDQLLNISFGLLEKEYFKKNTNVRDMVRMVKFVQDRRGWKGKPFYFKPFHVKRVAIKNHETLRTMRLWEGFRAILGCIKDELTLTGKIGGYFINEQVIYKQDRDLIKRFVQEIKTVLGMSAADIKTFL